MVWDLFGEIIHFINEKWRHYDLSTIRVREKKGMDGLTDVDKRTRTGVAYPMQVNGLLPLTDTGTRTRVHGQV